MIEFQQVNKTYRMAKKLAGMRNAVRAFFYREYETIHAMNDVSHRNKLFVIFKYGKTVNKQRKKMNF